MKGCIDVRRYFSEWIAGRRALLSLVKLALLLVIVNWLVAGPFFRGYLQPRYVDRFRLLYDRTGGDNPGIFFEALDRLSERELQVVFVGDSTMNPGAGPDTAMISFLVGERLRQRFPGVPARAIDASQIGLFAADGLLYVAKALGRGADVIVYGLTLRAFPNRTDERWVSRVSEQLSGGDLWRIGRVGGGRWMYENLTAEQVLGGLVYSSWATYAYRSSLRRFLWETALEPVVPAGSAVARALGPAGDPRRRIAPRAPLLTGFEWSRAVYGFPNANWRALELVGRLCARYAPRRCVMYAGPVNPGVRDGVAEPGMYEAHLRRLHSWAGRHQLVWLDLTDALVPADFRKPLGRRMDPVHPNPQGSRKLAALLDAPVSRAVNEALAQRGAADRASLAH